MDQNKPRSRDKNVLGGSGQVQKRGSGLGTGPVGNSSARPNGQNRPSGGYSKPSGTGSANGRPYGRGGKGGLGKIIAIIFVIIIIIVLLKMMSSNGGGSGAGSDILSGLGGMLGAGEQDDSYGNTSSSWQPAQGVLDSSVASGSRSKFTNILGNNQDQITIMVYMCGTDLESKHGMASSDLEEMRAASFGDNINLIVYTGGCKKWANDVISSSQNQIYQIRNGRLTCLENNMGKDPMTKASTLTSFIRYCTKNFPANRNELIFWDHGGGSLSGFGYDEKNAASGSMGLAQIDSALKDAGVQFDFIGFDACLMATLENGLMLSKYADYMIASEETEPGVGWYYTDWLTALSKDPAMPTIEIGKNIIDGFVETCARKCNGQKTTLSVVDLAELETTIPGKLTAFAGATKDLIHNDGYQTVSDARYKTREFAQSSKIDQVDLVHLAQNINNAESKELEKAVLAAVKYNRTSPNMTNANGLSVYFPYKKMSKVDAAVSEYKQIGMDSEYMRCIQDFAGMEATGQAHGQSSPSSGSPVGSLLGNLISGVGSGVGSGLDLSSLGFLSGSNQQANQTYVENNCFDASVLEWSKGSGGTNRISISDAQWKLIRNVELNVFYDDGSGYIDLGMDNMFTIDSAGNLVGDYDGTWLSINRQIVAYYYLDTVEEGSHYSISGYVPVLLNGVRAELILVFDDEHPTGYIAGARDVYKNGETETTAKNLTQVKPNDTVVYLCDYYSYDGKYQDSYALNDPTTLGNNVVIGNLQIEGGKTQATYCLTDIYQQKYWTPVLP